MRITRLCVQACLVVLVVQGCAASRHGDLTDSQERRAISLDTALVRAIKSQTLDSVVIDSVALPIELDRGGIAPDTSAMSVFQSIDRYVEVGLRMAGPAFRTACGSAMRAASDSSLTRGCPTTPRVYVVIGRPRRAGALRIADTDSARAVERQESSDDFRTVRVVLTSAGPRGRSTALYDFVFRQDSLGFHFVRAVPLLYVD